MHVLAVLEYDGTEFLGFQSQKRGRTVQDELERALGEFTNEHIRIVGGGRTDAGVHALGQTASFEMEWHSDPETLQRALNAKLPRDLAVRELRQVPEDFSARYDARSRTYLYTVLNTKTRAPLQERYALWVATRLDAEAMQQGAKKLVGRRDFRAFGTPPRGTNTIRRMLRSEVRRDNNRILFEFEADAFLYRMVRRLVGTLLQLGSGKIRLNEFQAIVDHQRRAGDSVPAHGLTLQSVNYDFDVIPEYLEGKRQRSLE